jgi:ketosteroid isomerase-like protein
VSATVLEQSLLDRYHAALGALINGDPGEYKLLLSHSEEVTLANPFGPAARGWAAVEHRLDRAAANYRDGHVIEIERIARYETPELAYLVEVERFEAKVGSGDELGPVALRVTTIFRLEHGAWKVVHRHADPITTERPVESVLGG